MNSIRTILLVIMCDKHHAQTNILSATVWKEKTVCSLNVWPLSSFQLRRENTDTPETVTQLGSLWQQADAVHYSPTHTATSSALLLFHHKYMLQQGNLISPKANFAILHISSCLLIIRPLLTDRHRSDSLVRQFHACMLSGTCPMPSILSLHTIHLVILVGTLSFVNNCVTESLQ
jgi:hypothetical protein